MSRNNHTLCLVGGSAEETAQLGHLLDERANAAWQLGDAANADVLCVDVDSVYGHMDWLKAQSSGRPVVALSSTDAHGAQYHLRKPLGSAALFGLLEQIAVHLPPPRTPGAHGAAASPAAARPALRAAVAAPAPAPTPAPAPVVAEPVVIERAPQTLLDFLEASVAHRVRLRANGLPTLILDGEERIAYAQDVALKALSDWCTQALAGASVDPLDTAAFTTQTRGLASLPFARLAWLAHLVGSNGELEADLDPASRYKLARWPQSEREFPKHFRIATAMVKAPATIDEIVAASGSSKQDVANFINAYRSSGHIEVESPAKGAGVEQRRGGLFGRNRKNIED